jgi:hypothetical protein
MCIIQNGRVSTSRSFKGVGWNKGMRKSRRPGGQTLKLRHYASSANYPSS